MISDEQIMIIQIWTFGRDYLKKEQSESATSRRTTDTICCQLENMSLQAKTEI